MAETIQSILSEELEILLNDIKDRIILSKQVASGKTRDSLAVRLTSPHSGVLEGASYIKVLETGRGPGKVPYDFKDILMRWAAAKGLSFNTQSDLDRFCYFVTKKIREEGNELYRSNQTIDIFETPIKEFRERLQRRVTNLFIVDIIPQNYFK